MGMRQHLSLVHLVEVFGNRLWEQDDVAFFDELMLLSHACEQLPKLLGLGPKAASVALFSEDRLSEIRKDGLEVLRVNGQTQLVLFVGRSKYSETERVQCGFTLSP